MFGKIKNGIKLSLIGFLVSSILCVTTYAQVTKDTDYDGISDLAETQTYKTNPLSSDTDGDGFIDSIEVTAGSNPTDPTSTPDSLNFNKLVPLLEKRDPIYWYLSRISGISAFILLTLTVSMGLVQTSKSLLKIKLIKPFTALEVHRSIAWMGLTMIVFHVGSLFFDNYFKLKLPEVFIPFKLTRTFTSSLGFDFRLPIALGVIALYTVLILIVTSEFRNKIVSAKVWRLIHYISFAGYVLFLIHGFTSGSDSNQLWMRLIYLGSMLLVFSLLLARIFRKQLFLPKVTTQLK